MNTLSKGSLLVLLLAAAQATKEQPKDTTNSASKFQGKRRWRR
jgi:hypothetical protein